MADVPQFTPSSSAEDLVLNFEKFETNTTSGAIKAVIERVNVTAGSTSYVDPDDGSVYVPTGTVGTKPVRVSLGREEEPSILIGGVAATLTVPANASHAEVHVYDASGIVFTTDGTDPSATVGTRLNVGATFEIEGADELANFKMFSLGAAATPGISAEYFNMGNDGTFVD